ncbi:MAG: aspartyl-tRNA(Asn)/glutamyl-tRNA(Gln) amidotransferase subunit [Candidatus Methanomethylophilaceae archaeon]|nr:aspartyl-tRNA(Asn)/glutamyl-tRNA(Gln) amidotransferase subunit [Candidatus Methanomethylophilaceae archaeon]MDI3541634.1 aspartyl-tRNA(Asn)/glutamyl-tRNA(Gln) amidotransferase subunit [Candidatus Methanomethylophilaceae archaeon]
MKIGLEIHVQLPTQSKMFCPCPTGAVGPNTAVCPTCLGMPGSRPSLNRSALEMGLKLAQLFKCRIPEKTWFSRKTYFYPDLAKHFQITQFDNPIGENGVFDFRGKSIRIRRVHLEEDPGSIKRVGRPGQELSLVDYNRSGIPLVEIVTEPDLSDPTEARQFLSDMLTEIRHIINLTEESEQSVRVDCNISVGKERVEVKNVTGLKNMERALKFEAMRQSKLLRAHHPVLRETRRYDEERRVTVATRKKEFEEDYGYIDEPDLGVFNVLEIAASLEVTETPLARAKRLARQYGISETTSRQMVNTSMKLCDLFEEMAERTDTDTALRWTGTVTASWSSIKNMLDEEMRDSVISTVERFHRQEINDTECRLQLAKLFGEKVQEPSETGLDEAIEQAIERNPGIFEDYTKNERAANRLIGEVIRETAGTYSSQEIVLKVRERLERGR